MLKKLISIVIPVYKEEKNIPLIYIELKDILKSIQDKYDYEIIFVNDGSSDNSWYEIEKIAFEHRKVKWINLSRNFGKEIAISAGIESAIWDCVITLDWDWQHPVEKIPDFIKEWEKWYQVVYNKRPNIDWASFFKKLSSKIFYKIFNTMSDFKLEPWTTDYRLLDRKVVNYFVKFGEKNRLYRGLTDWMWFNKKALIFNAKQRLDWWNGTYTYRNLFKLAVNSLTSFSLFPLKLVGYLWTIITISSIIMFSVIIVDRLWINYFGFSNLALVLILNTTLMWIVLVSLGFIAHYIGKIHEEVLWRPMYIVRDRLNFKNENEK